MLGFLLPENSRFTVALAAGIGVATVAAATAYWYHRKYLNNIPPTKWRKVGEVTDLIVYPIKSCGAIRVSEFGCSKLGPADGYLRDRIFMVVTKNGEFTTARKHPTLVLIHPKIEKNSSKMKLSAPGMIDIEIDIEKLYKKTPKKYIVWGQSVDGVDCGDDVAKWISRFILGEESGLWLVFYPKDITSREVRDKNKKFDTMLAEDSGALHDASSYMLFNESSLNDLNTRLDDPAMVLHFRPNIVVRGALPYEEDYWKWVKIGNNMIFRNVKPCTRCIFTTVNPETGVKSPDGNPLKTLRDYRSLYTGESPVLGIHLGLKSPEGKISLGDSVYVDC
ncbi:mitochondrial amidoxime-reducing component 1-like [Condylostylus longicornis]|uniref:mitochondrial amidoxime-reducing component 1-like n=1 Tax=Condylostylus longicornis TaxID=2530218 RepID=UPI00244DC0B4|nr:mitochondrial amidoxime-reducing component 1-like [Condylostylus longicornis]